MGTTASLRELKQAGTALKDLRLNTQGDNRRQFAELFNAELRKPGYKDITLRENQPITDDAPEPPIITITDNSLREMEDNGHGLSDKLPFLAMTLGIDGVQFKGLCSAVFLTMGDELADSNNNVGHLLQTARLLTGLSKEHLHSRIAAFESEKRLRKLEGNNASAIIKPNELEQLDNLFKRYSNTLPEAYRWYEMSLSDREGDTLRTRLWHACHEKNPKIPASPPTTSFAYAVLVERSTDGPQR